MPRPLRLGDSDFYNLRAGGYLFVDKSRFIKEVIQREWVVQLYPRPRRFGKTTNLSMLRYFLEKGPDYSEFFQDLEVWQDTVSKAHFQRYPVIHISFKAVKHARWADAKAGLIAAIAEEIKRLLPLLPNQRWQDLADRKLEPDTRILLELSHALHEATGQQVVILIDEYDAPLSTAWQYDEQEPGYYDQLAGWFRSLLEAGLKDNRALFRGVLTGILRVARESMFSGLNNVGVYGFLGNESAECFGFTQAEVEQLLKEFEREDRLLEIQRWYNGYLFGNTVIYNPWSVLGFLASPTQDCQPYWMNSSGNELAHSLLLQRTELSEDTERLLKGEIISREIEENTTLRDLQGDQIWGLLLLSGYLKPVALVREQGRLLASLTIPNEEVRLVWESTFRDWLKAGLGRLEPFFEALLSGNGARVELLLSRLVLKHISSHDVAETQAEAFYHAFILGLLVALEKSHQVRSNREEGLGRSDVRLLPKEAGKPGVVIEFKAEDGRKLETLAKEALEQVEKKRYLVELEEAGAKPIYAYGVAFAGKRVVVRWKGF
jgi:hypothetical protein